MKRLHSSYHNLGSWKFVREQGGAELRMVYNARPVCGGALFLSLLCALFAWLLNAHLPATSGKPLAVIMIVATGILVPVIMIGYARKQIGKKPLLAYRPAEDLLVVREPAMEIKNASRRVSFSLEHFREHSESYFEFNIVIDGVRKKFLSSIANSFKSLVRDLNEMGFDVSDHYIKN